MPLDNREAAGANGEPQPVRFEQAPHPRAVGAPLPRGGSRQPSPATQPARTENLAPGRAFSGPVKHPGAQDRSSGVQRAAHALRTAVPFVQRLLPLLEGNLASAVSNVLTSQAAKPGPPITLAPIQQGMSDLQVQQRQLRDQIVEQQTSLKRVEDHLGLVREATDRNTLEQQELMADLKAVGRKVNIVAVVALVLLSVSVILNLLLYLHMGHLLP